MSDTFHCDDCGQDKPRKREGGTGYASTPDGRTVCYDCCAIRDKAEMIREGRATLYLSRAVAVQSSPTDRAAWVVTNWPGTLRFVPRNVRRFNHPFAREAWVGEFTGPDGKLWRFKNIGDSQIAHCRRSARA
jgi:hypothetical protein